MNKLQLSITRLLGNGRTEWEPDGGGYTFNEVLSPATLSDFHRLMDERMILWSQITGEIRIFEEPVMWVHRDIPYDSSKDLISQDEPTLKAIINLINSHS